MLVGRAKTWPSTILLRPISKKKGTILTRAVKQKGSLQGHGTMNFFGPLNEIHSA